MRRLAGAARPPPLLPSTDQRQREGNETAQTAQPGRPPTALAMLPQADCPEPQDLPPAKPQRRRQRPARLTGPATARHRQHGASADGAACHRRRHLSELGGDRIKTHRHRHAARPGWAMPRSRALSDPACLGRPLSEGASHLPVLQEVCRRRCRTGPGRARCGSRVTWVGEAGVADSDENARGDSAVGEVRHGGAPFPHQRNCWGAEYAAPWDGATPKTRNLQQGWVAPVADPKRSAPGATQPRSVACLRSCTVPRRGIPRSLSAIRLIRKGNPP